MVVQGHRQFTVLVYTHYFCFSQGMPEVSYVKAIDVWTLACIVFVFGTILEYIVVLRYQSTQEKGPSTYANAWCKKTTLQIFVSM